MGMNMLTTKAKDPTDAIFGTALDGSVYHYPISKGPHWLVCGQTGSGKSVMVNGILISMIFHAHPEELKIIWVDPKKVEATAYIGLPHCPIDPIIDMEDAYACLLYLAAIMDERYERMADIQVKNLPEYNDWIEEHPDKAEAKGYTKDPYIVCVIDEYADMKDQIGADVEVPIKRLGQKARAAGIHLVLATQRPSAEIVSPTIRSNVPARVGMKTIDAGNSNLIIQRDGCEMLKLGEAYIMTNDGMTRVKGPYISNEEIAAIFKHLREKYGEPETIDYKTYCVDNGLADWAESDYDEKNVPLAQRHVKKKAKSRFGGF
jgi:DNA segregation ATPase ftsK/spoIIIE